MNSTELAARLGVTREVFPELFDDPWCSGCAMLMENCYCNKPAPTVDCSIPLPDSDDPRACLWEPFLMRALGWRNRIVKLATSEEFGTTLDAGWHHWPKEFFATPTAALYAAWLAQQPAHDAQGGA